MDPNLIGQATQSVCEQEPHVLENVAAWHYAEAKRHEPRREYHEEMGDALMWRAHRKRDDDRTVGSTDANLS